MVGSKLKMGMLGAVVAVAGISTASANHIDFFADDQDAIDSTLDDGPTTNGPQAAPAAGGGPMRTVSAELLTSTAGGNASVRIDDGNNDFLSFNSGGGTTANFLVTYDYAAPIDLVDAGGANWNALNIDAQQSNSATADLFVTVTDIASVSGVFTLMDLGVFSGGQDIIASYDDFVSAGTVDFSQISQIVFNVQADDSPLGTDILIDEVTRVTVPVPASLALLALGLIGSAQRRRRQAS